MEGYDELEVVALLTNIGVGPAVGCDDGDTLMEGCNDCDDV